MIIFNAVQCLHCKSIIRSLRTHDFQTCSCKRVSVDGGQDYLKRLYKADRAEDDYIELSKVIILDSNGLACDDASEPIYPRPDATHDVIEAKPYDFSNEFGTPSLVPPPIKSIY